MFIINEKFYKWFVKNDVYLAGVIGNTAYYYKNGEVYALYQQWQLRDTDIEITEKEFNNLLNLK